MREIADINYFTTKELLAELRKRGALPPAPAPIWDEGWNAGWDDRDESVDKVRTDLRPNPYEDKP